MIHPLFACPVCLAPHCRHFMKVAARDYWRCNRCEATFLDPHQWLDRTAELEYYQLHRNEVNDPGYRKFLARLATPLLERLPPGSHGLDYGCGPGPALAAMLAEGGHHMAVFDPIFFNDPVVLQDRYDFVTCTEVVEHFHRPFDEFAQLHHLLKPGGCLAVMTTLLTDATDFARWYYRRDPTHVVFYRETTFRLIAERFAWRCEFPAANVALMHNTAR